MTGNRMTALQNTMLAILIIAVFYYMRKKDLLPRLTLHGAVPSAIVGIVLGFFSSFLGIGGGPVNVALIVFAFGYSMKAATACSLAAILSSQAAKLFSAVMRGDLTTTI